MALIRYLNRLIQSKQMEDSENKMDLLPVTIGVKRDRSGNTVSRKSHHHHHRSRLLDHQHARTTIINHKQISKVIECYSKCTHHFNPIVNSSMVNNRYHRESRNNQQRNYDYRYVIDDTSFDSTDLSKKSTASIKASLSVCRSCKMNGRRRIAARFCKCCGKRLLHSSSKSSSLSSSTESTILTLRKQQQQQLQLKQQPHHQIIINDERYHLKKFKAMSNIKQNQHKSVSLSSKANHQDTKQQQQHQFSKRRLSRQIASRKSKLHLKKSRSNRLMVNSDDDGLRLSKIEEYLKNLQQTCSSFQVDFASTPIKTAPKTSTPKKSRIDAKSF